MKIRRIHMRNYSRFLSLLLTLVMVFSLFTGTVSENVVTAAGNQPTTYSDEYNSGTRDVTCTTLSGTGASSYYTGSYTYDTLSTQSSSSLLQSLRTLMTSTHKKISSYDDCHYKADRTDCQNGNKKVTLIYTSYEATMSQWNGWNREHVWPQSLGGDNTRGGGADLHHIRPSDAGVNSSRGNKKYGNAPGGTEKKGSNPATGYLGGHYSSTYFEPLDNVKGDVARICLYVYVRWGSDWGADSITKVFQSVDVLLEWMELDPVDTWEMGRNEVVEDIQGNRNVFIDYPEYAWLLFGEDVPAGVTTPSGKGGSGGSGGSSGGNTTCPHSNTEVRGAQSASCTTNGYTGDTYCKNCGEKTATGTSISAYGHADTDGNGKCDKCSTAMNTSCDHRRVYTANAKAATCTEAGYTGDTYCEDCNTKLSTGTSIAATGHKDADNDGNCDICTPASCDHRRVVARNAVAATCTTDGYSGDMYCEDCNAALGSGQTIPATGHTDTNNDNLCDTCNTIIDPNNTVSTTPPTEESTPATEECTITTVPATGPATIPTDDIPAINNDSNENNASLWIVVGILVLAATGIVVLIILKKKKTN